MKCHFVIKKTEILFFSQTDIRLNNIASNKSKYLHVFSFSLENLKCWPEAVVTSSYWERYSSPATHDEIVVHIDQHYCTLVQRYHRAPLLVQYYMLIELARCFIAESRHDVPWTTLSALDSHR